MPIKRVLEHTDFQRIIMEAGIASRIAKNQILSKEPMLAIHADKILNAAFDHSMKLRGIDIRSKYVAH